MKATIHLPTPFDLEKNLGKAYNHEFTKVAEDDYVCLRDLDTLFLLPDTPNHLYKYVELYPDVDVFTCYTNRNKATIPFQLLNGRVSEITDIKYHIVVAEKQKKFLYQATEITGNISGFFMLISKRLWNEIKFPETGKCMYLDHRLSWTLRNRGKKIMRMDGVYVWHTYRLLNGVDNVNHLL